MRRKLCALLMAAALVGLLPVRAFAISQTYEVPVTLTMAAPMRKISVTIPASLPVSVTDGMVLTATNAVIKNTGECPVQVVGVTVQAGAYAIGDYMSFAKDEGSIALRINGCPTAGPGPLAISDNAFPVMRPGDRLPIRYDAKVAAHGETEGVTAATVVFTIANAEGA